MLELHNVAGVSGMLLYVASYAGLQMGVLRGETLAYPALNLAAAALVLTSLSVDFNLASALIQIMWIGISVFGLCRIQSQRAGAGRRAVTLDRAGVTQYP